MRKKSPVTILTLLLMTLLISQPACQRASPNFQVLSLDIIPPEVKIGERVTVRAELRNARAKTQTYNVPLMVNGVAQDRKTVMLRPGATEVVEFSVVKHKAGSYTVSIGDRSSTLQVQPLSPPSFEISDLEIIPAVANVNAQVVITAKVANTGDTQGSYTAELKINGITIQTEEITIIPGTKYMVVFKLCTESPGTYTVALGELTGKLTILEPIQPVPPAPNNPTPPQPSRPCRPGG